MLAFSDGLAITSQRLYTEPHPALSIEADLGSVT